MTTQKPEMLPDEIWVWKYVSENEHRNVWGETGTFNHVENQTRYTRTDLYTAAIADSRSAIAEIVKYAEMHGRLQADYDALRDFQAEIVRVYFDPTISEIEAQAAIHRMMTEAKDSATAKEIEAYEKASLEKYEKESLEKHERAAYEKHKAGE